MELLAGVDEAGRGPLAGPVIAAAVILDPQRPIEGLMDSKKLTERKRAYLFDEIQSRSLAWAVGRAEVAEIDDINILQASLLAMKRAIECLSPFPTHVQIDGTHSPSLSIPATTIIKGDQKVQAISAASILAKVSRDREMIELDATYPGYGFAQHKGYPTKLHIDALNSKGITPIHRRSFAPVAKLILSTPA